MKKKILLTTLISTFTLFNVFSQQCPQLSSEVDVAFPSFVDNQENNWKDSYSSWQEYVESQIKNGNYSSSGNGKIWTVFSDRENNTTYSSPNGSSCSSLSFMEKVHIAKISNGWVLVYSDNNNLHYPQINSSAKSKGWIRIENLLLWYNCPKNKNNILGKGLVVTDLENAKKFGENISFTYTPNNSSAKYGNAEQLDIFFVMKTEKNNGKTYYLLSKYAQVETAGNNQDITVLGWLSQDYLTEWDQRLCLEPASSNISCLKNRGLYPEIIADKSFALDYYSNQATSKERFLLKASFDNQQREKGGVMRYPILNKENDHLFKAVIIGTDENQTKNIANLRTELDRYKQSLNNINIIFVLDATNSMKPYFTAVANSLNNIIKTNFSQNVKMGVVVYRNAADGNREIEINPSRKLTDNYTEIVNFISATECFSKGAGYYESFYKGLEKALDKNLWGYIDDQNTFIIAIGDCGNESDDVRLNKIGETMNSRNINFFAYNVGNQDDKAYSRYKNQVVKILQKSIDNSHKNNQTQYVIDIEDEEHYGVFVKGTKAKSNFFFGGVRLASCGNIGISTFNKVISGTVLDFIKYTNEQIIEIESTLSGASNNRRTMSAAVNCDFYKELFESRNIQGNYRDACNLLGAKKWEGYVPREISQCDEKLFDYVLFFSFEELSNLTSVLKNINPSKGTGSSPVISDDQMTRKKYQDALIALGKSFLGEKADISNMNLGNLMQQIYGMPIKIDNCGISSIKDITNSNIINREDFLNFANKFFTKTRNLENITKSLYNESFTLNNKQYYWVPFRDMPGYCAE